MLGGATVADPILLAFGSVDGAPGAGAALLAHLS